MTVGEIKGFLNYFKDDTEIYADSNEGLFTINKELCGQFTDEKRNVCPSLHIELKHNW